MGRTFLISAKHPECADFDFGLLLRAMAADVTVIRSVLPEFEHEAHKDIPAFSKMPAILVVERRTPELSTTVPPGQCTDAPLAEPLQSPPCFCGQANVTPE